MDEIKTFNEHRRSSNPDEAKLYEVACKLKQDYSKLFDCAILGVDGRGNSNGYLNQREEQIVFSTLQWLGSPVGKSFLKQSGYIKEE